MIGVRELFYPPLSTVVLPHYQLGQQAALHIIEERQQNSVEYVACDLLERNSFNLAEKSKSSSLLFNGFLISQ